MAAQNSRILLLCDDIDRGRVIPLTTLKNLESVIENCGNEFADYDKLLTALEEWNYVKLLCSGD